jgi:hypothetical protein
LLWTHTVRLNMTLEMNWESLALEPTLLSRFVRSMKNVGLFFTYWIQHEFWRWTNNEWISSLNWSDELHLSIFSMKKNFWICLHGWKSNFCSRLVLDLLETVLVFFRWTVEPYYFSSATLISAPTLCNDKFPPFFST